MTSQPATRTAIYKRLTSSNGTVLCVLDPATEISGFLSLADCGRQCVHRGTCEAFNVRQAADSTAQCQLYNYQPSACGDCVGVMSGCSGYVVQTTNGRMSGFEYTVTCNCGECLNAVADSAI